MTTEVGDRAFVSTVLEELVHPAADQLMDSRYFQDLRAGKLTVRRMQGFSLQHTWFNRGLLKGGSLRMIKASDRDDTFMDALWAIEGEITHPDMCKKFGLALGLTEDDFRNELPLHEVVVHTSVIVASPLLSSTPIAGRAGGMSDETIVQRYATEFAEYLPKPPYSIDEDALEFFYVHGLVDKDHSAAHAEAVARLIRTDRDRAIVWDSVKSKIKVKLAKWEAIYDHYA